MAITKAILISILLITLVALSPRPKVEVGWRLTLVHALGLASDITVPAGGDLQAAIISALPGDTITTDSNATYTGNFELLVKGGTQPITIQSSRASELPVNVRVSPAQASLMTQLRSSVNGLPVLSTQPGAANYVFIGMDIATTNASVVVYDLVRLGGDRFSQTTLSSVPSNIFLDRSWAHGWDTQDVQRGVALNCANCGVTNSYVSEIHGVGYDTQAVAGWNGPGPIHLINNYLEGAAENILFGGADPGIANLVPSDIEIRRNHVFKPLFWNPYDQANFKSPFGQAITWTTNPKGCSTEDPSQVYRSRYVDSAGCIAKHWTVKNLLELKNAKNVVMDGNVFENNWPDGQVGIPILFTVRNQECSAPWSTIQNVTFSNNIVKNAIGALNLLGEDNDALIATSDSCKDKTNPKPGSIRGSDALVSNNVFSDIRGPFLTLNGFNNFKLRHNTQVELTGNLTTLYGQQSNGFEATDNLLQDHDYGIYGEVGLIGVAGLTQWTPGYIFQGNYIANPYDQQSYPPNNAYLSSLNLPADYRSPYPGVGADIDTLNAAQSGTVITSPSPSPTPSPSASPIPSPSPNPTPAIKRSVMWPKQQSRQNIILAAQWLERFKLNRSDGNVAEFEKVP